jgi:hypothetical protein
MRALLLLVAITTTAWADDGEAPAASHKGQFGVSVRSALGVRGIATYENTRYCGKTDASAQYGFASVCTGRSPLALDVELSYAFAKRIDVVVEIRLGLERDFGANPALDGPRPFHLSPGARFFFSEADRVKVFVQPQLVFDFSGHRDQAGNAIGNDIGVRGIQGVWIDLHRTYGAYVYVAETLQFSRWLSASFELGVGFQARYP